MASDLSTIMTDQTNNVNLYVKSIKSQSLDIPIVIQNGNTGPQPIMWATAGLSNGLYNFYPSQKAWLNAVMFPGSTFTYTTPQTNSQLNFDNGYISSQNFGDYTGSANIPILVTGVYRLDFSIFKSYTSGTIEDIFEIDIFANGINNGHFTAPVTFGNGAVTSDGGFTVSGSMCLNLSPGPYIHLVYTSNISAGSITLASGSLTIEMISPIE